MLRSRILPLVLAAGLLGGAGAGSASAASLPGVPAGASLLFTLDADGGRWQPAGDHARLTLTGVEPVATWFTDRPDRDAGRIGTQQLVDAWDDLGFTRVPPNAALVLQRAHRSRDTLAIELRRPVYDAARRTLRLEVRRLSGLRGGLDRLGAAADRRIARRFSLATLFIDNASAGSQEGCNIGQPQLMGFERTPAGMLPADGRRLRIRDHQALAMFHLGRTVGDDDETFALPTLTAPVAGTRWFVCARGNFGWPGNMGDCELGEVDLWYTRPSWELDEADATWLPADGRTVHLDRSARWHQQLLGGGRGPVTLPKLDAPPGTAWLVCVRSYAPDGPAIGQIDLFAAEPPDEGRTWLPADGRVLRVRDHMALDAKLNGLDRERTTFRLPSLEAPAPGLRYYIAANGVWLPDED